MEYNDTGYDRARTLVERWLAGETTLAEEAALREFFAGVEDELPDDLRPCRAMFGQSAGVAASRSPRKLILHTEPEPVARRVSLLRRGFAGRSSTRWSVAAAVAAAAIVGTVLLITPERAVPESDIVCMVNGVRITDPTAIDAYTRRALEMVNDNLQKPASAVESELTGNPALTRAARVLNSITIETNN
jgi:hypothetical protein